MKKNIQNLNITEYTSIDETTKHLIKIIKKREKTVYIPTENRRYYNPTFTLDIKTKTQTCKHLQSQILTPDNITRIKRFNTDSNIKEQQRKCRQNTLLNNITINISKKKTLKTGERFQ